MTGTDQKSGKIRWDKAGEAELVLLDGERLTVLSTVPAAPGTPLKGKLLAEAEMPVELKVFSSKKTPEGRFTIVGRVVNLTRELRAALQAKLGLTPS